MERLGKLRDFFAKDPETKEKSVAVNEVTACEVCKNTSFYSFWELRICTYCNEVYLKR